MVTKLHIVGKNYVNSLGQKFNPHGVNRGHMEDFAHGAWGGWSVFDPADCDGELDAMKTWGINVLRLYVNVQSWMEQPQREL